MDLLVSAKKVLGVQDKQLLAHSAKQLKFHFKKLPQFYLNHLLCQAASFENGCMHDKAPPSAVNILFTLFDLW